MAGKIDFYFDFSSPYGYFAAEQIEGLAARFGRDVDWHPVLLGVVWKSTGIKPLVDIPRKGAYARHDWERISRLTGTAYREPPVFPVATQYAARAFLVAKRIDGVRAKHLALALFRAYFVQGHDIGNVETVLDVCAHEGWNRVQMHSALNDSEVKTALKDEVALAEGHGVFGSPFMIADSEPFWGWDRLPMLEQWLERGGF